MINEFRTLNVECSNLVPRGPGYENITLENQVCPVVGAIPGQTTVNGLRYLKLSYNYELSHMGRVRITHIQFLSFLSHCDQNFGILVAFGIAFFAAYLIITEFRSKLAEMRSVVTFKRGSSDIDTSAPKAEDVESIATANSIDGLPGDGARAEKASATAEKMTNTFTWKDLYYTVPIGEGDQRRLLNDISGYVVPGKLTALMGESGAGKVRPPSFIGTLIPANRTKTDHVVERPRRAHERRRRDWR